MGGRASTPAVSEKLRCIFFFKKKPDPLCFPPTMLLFPSPPVFSCHAPTTCAQWWCPRAGLVFLSHRRGHVSGSMRGSDQQGAPHRSRVGRARAAGGSPIPNGLPRASLLEAERVCAGLIEEGAPHTCDNRPDARRRLCAPTLNSAHCKVACPEPPARTWPEDVLSLHVSTSHAC